MKGYSTLIPIKCNNSNPRNKGFHKTPKKKKKSHEKNSRPSNYIMKVTQGTKGPHRKLAQTLNNKPN